MGLASLFNNHCPSLRCQIISHWRGVCMCVCLLGLCVQDKVLNCQRSVVVNIPWSKNSCLLGNVPYLHWPPLACIYKWHRSLGNLWSAEAVIHLSHSMCPSIREIESCFLGKRVVKCFFCTFWQCSKCSMFPSCWQSKQKQALSVFKDNANSWGEEGRKTPF